VSDVLLSTLDDGVLTLTLHRPDAMNAFDQELNDAFIAALVDADADPEVRVVVVTGAGGRAFSAGADLKSVAAGKPTQGDPEWGSFGTRQRIAKPLIAAVDGIAFGGGFELALTADILVASRSSRFALPEVKVGLYPGAGGALRLVRQLPLKLAMLHMLTGDPIDAETAAAHGLVSRLTEPGEALAQAQAIAKTIAANAPLGVVGAKQVAYELHEGRSGDEESAWRLNDELFPQVLASDDAREGATAFAEKRAPRWTGR